MPLSKDSLTPALKVHCIEIQALSCCDLSGEETAGELKVREFYAEPHHSVHWPIADGGGWIDNMGLKTAGLNSLNLLWSIQ